ncbi:glycoside hydrolase family 13 protein [Pelosinus fermentans]|uniref:Oligo-1,6-glucosidase n=1 Tax=Pelosinus fermentans JBW45 TaxID=1192197 RepID=I9NUS3_9FIRM|nr:alpha-glucosidase [Pelosinus fermentans]AJQ28446.1 Oligo-1,6-glucosidase [Pelosinus fermentans JBW45]
MDSLKWWQKTLVYQIYPKSFCDSSGDGIGDLNGITEKLDYIRNLGVGAVWLTPVYVSPMVDNGYDIADYKNIAPEYGTMADMENLIVEAKKRGIRIVMDLVFNHTSDQHNWFKESRSDCKNSKRDWYIWCDAKPNGAPPTNWRGIFGGSAWTFDEATGQYYLHTFAKEQPDLNWENPEVRRILYDIANFWLDKGVGGFRIDAITYIKKPVVLKDLPIDGPDGMSNVHMATANQPGILEYLHEFKREVFAGKDIFTVAEANGVSAEELPRWVGKNGAFDMLLEFNHMNLDMEKASLWCRPAPWKLTKLKKALSDSQKATTENGWYPAFFENHDQPRSVNQFFPKNADKKLAAKVIATVLFTLKGTPFIYEGQELGMTNTKWSSIECYDDIASKGQYALALQEGFSKQQALEFVWKYSRDNARTPMQWTSAKNAGFTSGKPWLSLNENYNEVNAGWQMQDEDSVLRYYHRLAKVRQEYDILLKGSYEELLEADEQIYAYMRVMKEKKVIVLCNFSEKEKEYSLPKLSGNGKLLLGNYADAPNQILRAYEARVYLCEGRTTIEGCSK